MNIVLLYIKRDRDEKRKEMKITLSAIKTDIGSIGGHIKPSQRLLDRVREFVDNNGKGLIEDSSMSHTGDDITTAPFFIAGKG